jgi:uncharacterized protein (DUF885 family)
MKWKYLPLALLLATAACRQGGNTQALTTQSAAMNKDLAGLLDQYWNERMQLFPLEATANGDNRYNDKMNIDISESFRESLMVFYEKQLAAISKIDSAKLNDNDRLSYMIFKRDMNMAIEGLRYPGHLMPVNQFWGLTLELPVLGSAQGNQPFKTAQDYDNFLKRGAVFSAWTDTAIANMRKGMELGMVLPQALVKKVIPQLRRIADDAVTKSPFYGPVTQLPKEFSEADRKKYTDLYTAFIKQTIQPAYGKLATFLQKEYLPKARTTSGIGALPNGEQWYGYQSRYWTTTDLTPDSIYQIGLQQIAFLESEMNKVKDEVGFKGSLQEMFTFINTDKQFKPFKTPQEILDNFKAILEVEEPHLKELFKHRPKSPFEIRQTEAFRAASASAEYNPPSEDGSRPGIFYVPILDAKEFNKVGMVTLFLHEAIPGHHYQIALQQENKDIPKFRRFIWYGAYGEGWALYAESLGKTLGVFTDPYQYFGHLSDAMHRAIRLVVDVGLHTKGMTREEAIAFMMKHERISEEEATAEIERYMAIPGQALSYMIGKLKIQSLRDKYQAQMGDKFNIADFHEQVLKDGCMPLNVLEEKLDKWAK